MAENKERTLKKNIPTILPSGFGIRINQRKMAMLDFVDIDYENNPSVIGSYALDEKMLEDLAKAVNEILGKIKNDKL